MRLLASRFFGATVSFNPRTPCGVRPISRALAVPTLRFQSTHSLRSATDLDTLKRLIPAVSIHALLAECDRILLDATARSISFNPRTPCGVRRLSDVTQMLDKWFQSTHSLRSATDGNSASGDFDPVSIHALLAECDLRPLPRYVGI